MIIPRSRSSASALVVAFFVSVLLCLAAAARAQSSNVSVFITGLEFPRGLTFGPDLNLYVAEGGNGGNMSTVGQCKQVPPPIGPYTGGFTARISKITINASLIPGGLELTPVNRITFVGHLPSDQTSPESGGLVSGVADVKFINYTLYALIAGAGCSHGLENTNNEILRVNPDGSTIQVANLSQFQKTHPVKNPEPDDFEPDGTWYSMVPVNGDLFAVEPNHGELDRIFTDGHITRVLDISAHYGHIVPTAVVYNPKSGRFLVGNLDTFPIQRGSSVILSIQASPREVNVVATGFTTIVGLALDEQNRLYVLENTTGPNQFPTPGTGKIVRLDLHTGARQVIASGLDLPTAMTFGPDGNLYVSNWGFGPPNMGEILKVTVP